MEELLKAHFLQSDETFVDLENLTRPRRTFDDHRPSEGRRMSLCSKAWMNIYSLRLVRLLVIRGKRT